MTVSIPEQVIDDTVSIPAQVIDDSQYPRTGH